MLLPLEVLLWVKRMCGYHFQQNSSKSTIYIKKVVSNCTKLNFQFNFYPKPEFFVKKHHKCAKLRSRPLCWRGTPSGFEIYTQRLEMVESCLSSNHSTNLQAPGISPEGSHLIVRSSIRLRGAKITFTVLSSLPFSTKYHPHWPSSHGCDLSGDPLWKWCKCGSLEAQTSGQGTQD